MQRQNLLSKKMKKKTPQALSPLALLTLAACGGGGDENVGLSFSTNENATSLSIGSVLSGSETVAASTYALSGEDADRFELSADGELSLKEPANYELQDSYEITIEVTTTTAAEVEGEESSITTATRDYTVNVVNVNDPATGSLTVAGTPAQGETLAADTSAVSDEDGVGTMSYQWYRDGELITGEVSSELTLTQADVGSVISADISYVDGSGATETFESASTAAVSNTNDAPTGAPVIAGTFSQDRELSVDVSSIADADGLGDFSYQWNRDGAAIEGATAATYTLSEADVGANISVTVSYTDGYGAAESVVSAETADIAKANDAPTGSLVISGTAAEGDILTLDTSSIADVDGVVGGFSYVWMKAGAVLAGETGSTYTLTQADVGSVFSASVSYVDGLGVTETLSAEPTAAVANVNDDPTGSLALSGTLEKGSALTLDSSSIADEDGLGEFSITWLSDDTPIAGATGATYTLSADEVGKTISATIEYTDGQGTVETVTSAATSTVKDVIVESIGAISAVNTGSGSNMVLEFYAEDSLVGTTVNSFDAVVTFDTADATYVSATIHADLGFPNQNDGVINISGISIAGVSSADPLFTVALTDQNSSDDLAVYVTDVLVNNAELDGSTLLIA